MDPRSDKDLATGALKEIFGRAKSLKDGVNQSIEKCKILERMGNTDAGLTVSLLSIVAQGLDISVTAIGTQILQQRQSDAQELRIKELEQRLAEIETPSVVRLAKKSNPGSPSRTDLTP